MDNETKTNIELWDEYTEVPSSTSSEPLLPS